MAVFVFNNIGYGATRPVGITLPHDPNIQRLEQLANPKDGRIDYAKAQSAIDHMADSTIDEATTLAELDLWAATIRARIPVGASSLDKLNILGSTLYVAGPWNGNHPFSYDMDDPFGAKIENKLIATYLHTRKGNCVSMPILIVILGQKLGLNVTLAQGPSHDFAKFQKDDGTWVNIEATSAESPTDADYQRLLHITPLAIQTGIYMRPLTHREVLGAMIGTLEGDYAHTRPPEYLLKLSNVALQINPKDINALVWKADAYFLLMQQRYLAHGLTPAALPSEQRADFQQLYNANVTTLQQAVQLGWQPPSKQDDAEYLERVKKYRVQH